MSVGLRAGIDVGGTFTDVILADNRGRLVIEKVLTTPSDPSIGAKQGVAAALERFGTELDMVQLAIHATTLVTNAIIERRGARTGMITTRGFRDILEIGGGTRYDIYDLFLPFPAPLVERRFRREVDERINTNGELLKPLDLDATMAELAVLADEGVESVAICFLHSYRSNAHEQEVLRLIRREFPQLEVSLSSDLSAQLGEYERFSTTVANAYVQPLMSRYLAELDTWLRGGRLLLMGSNGGTVSVSTARRWPITLIESGPAAGALAAADYSSRIGRSHVVSFDMGGTTAKICLIDDGIPSTSPDFEAARAERFKPGSGLPLQIPVINLIEIGAGGGSIARVNDLGLLKVGPTSAGADPGPSCYGRGGVHATVTDANLVLGYLDEHSFLGGAMVLDRRAAEAATAHDVAEPLGFGLVEAAWGVHEIVNETMAAAMRMHVAERNRDPRRYSMIAFGGAGPAHAVAVARKVGIREVIVPFGAGATSAYGLLIAAPVIDLGHTYVVEIGSADWAEIGSIYVDLERRATELLAETGVGPEDVRFERSVDVRYTGQAHQIPVPLAAANLAAYGETELREAFTRRYAELYSLLNPDFSVEALTWRLRATGPAQELRVVPTATSGTDGRAAAHRDVYFPGHGYVSTSVRQHHSLKPGETIRGPAIVEQRESTAVIGVSDSAAVDVALNLVIAVDGRNDG
ncbi:MAG: hydantoinase/oxoprolinase family protein [Thermoleophilia bacterium]|nr:hydantoinase/oxoprolinase family protein [Thermoleophilia bacterium]